MRGRVGRVGVLVPWLMKKVVELGRGGAGGNCKRFGVLNVEMGG